MGFSTEWNEKYSNNEHMSIWPWSDLISYFYRYAGKNNVKSVLEIGCGAGANIPFFKALGLDYHAVEGSEFIVRKLKEKYPEYKDNIKCGDFSEFLSTMGGAKV